MSSKIYDYAIIGGGLSGLLIANAIQNKNPGKKIALLEAGDMLGGNCHPQNTKAGIMGTGYKSIPESAEAHAAIDFLEEQLRTSTIRDVRNETPITYESGKFCEFLGFGDRSPAFVNELNYYLQNPRIHFATAPHAWIEILKHNFQGELMLRSRVTRFHIQDEKVTHLTVNGTKTIAAEHIVYAGNLKEILPLLPNEALNSRRRQSIGKTPAWSVIALDLVHKAPVSESAAPFLLMSGTDHPLPCLGYFMPKEELAGETVQRSHWLSFASIEDVEDTEQTAHIIREMKRQIKRAFHDALDGLKFERIILAPNSHFQVDLKLEGARFPDVSNLWMASSAASEQKNLLGLLLQAKNIIESLNFEQKQLPENTEVCYSL